MNPITRRQFLENAALLAAAGNGLLRSSNAQAADAVPRKMTIDLVCGSIGVSANPRQAIEFAARFGFESVEPNSQFLASLSDDQLADLKADMKTKNLVFSATGLPVEFRQDEGRFSSGLKELPAYASSLQRAGATRISTWLMPCHGSLTYVKNFHQHAARLKAVASILKDHGVRLGLEYVGPRTSWTSQRYPFLHTLAEMKDLIAEIGTGNVGVLLDSWHWWHAGDTVKDLLALQNADIVAVDLNDAPTGVPKEQMPDNKRELPCATGVIDLGAFLSALNQVGYDGPVRAEPFNRALSSLPKEEACAAAAKALKQAFALIHS
jgi:sugar phosphate isomerase/epimerase